MRWMAVVAMAAALGGCYPTYSPESPRVSVTCHAGKDCEVAWGKAWRWVESASERPIKKVDDYRIVTATPKDGETEIAYEITKRAISNNTYEIVFFAWCRNPFGCGEDLGVKAKKFIYYIE